MNWGAAFDITDEKLKSHKKNSTVYQNYYNVDLSSKGNTF